MRYPSAYVSYVSLISYYKHCFNSLFSKFKKMKKQLISVVDFWNKNRFSNKTLPQIPRGIFFSLLFFGVYLSLATMSVPTTCDPVGICLDNTPTGTITIRPRIEAPDAQECMSVNTTDYPYGIPMSKSILRLLDANNFNVSSVFGNAGDKTKWRVHIVIGTTCDNLCSGNNEYQVYTHVYDVLDTDYKIVRTVSSGVPGFAIELLNVPISRNLTINVTMMEPCKEYSGCPNSPAACTTFSNKFFLKENFTNVVNGQEFRMTLAGQLGYSLNCADCK
jgi:hypothetical protein